MLDDTSPKVLNPTIALGGLGGALSAAGMLLSEERLRDVGLTLLGASLAVAGIGWLATDPLREPYIEAGFDEPDPELAEHQIRATE